MVYDLFISFLSNNFTAITIFLFIDISLAFLKHFSFYLFFFANYTTALETSQNGIQSIHCMKYRFRYILWSSFKFFEENWVSNFKDFEGEMYFFLAKHTILSCCACAIYLHFRHTPFNTFHDIIENGSVEKYYYSYIEWVSQRKTFWDTELCIFHIR